MHILCDQDGVLSSWGEGWNHHLSLDAYMERAVNLPRHEDQRSFNLKEGLSPEEAEVVDEIFNHPGFYATLKPIEGAVEGYHKLVEAGHHVQVATSPWWTNATCLQDKADWVERHLGADARSKMILTSDKTTIRADFLIDDKPSIVGLYNDDRAWRQVIFSQPYNLDVEGHLRMDGWHAVDEALDLMEEELYNLSCF